MNPAKLNKQIEKAKKVEKTYLILFLILFFGMIFSNAFLAIWLENNLSEFIWISVGYLVLILAFGIAGILKIQKMKAQKYPTCPFCNHAWDEISVRIVIATRNCTNCLNEVITLDPSKPQEIET
jgi:uncharacterized membrane protein (DUF485 family)